MDENEIARKVVNAAFYLHRQTGPGMFERVYRDCLMHLLAKEGLKVEMEKEIPFNFEGLAFPGAYRLDLIIEDKVIIEVKSCASLSDIHMAQIITYLKLSKRKLGLLINFNVPRIKDGIRRVANGI